VPAGDDLAQARSVPLKHGRALSMLVVVVMTCWLDSA
jgi:hypothetical protein